jgi:sugar phosphate permease
VTPKPSMPRSRRPFFGWWVSGIAAAMFAIQTAAWGATFGAYLLQVQDEFGWSKLAISSAFSASHVISGLIAPGQGWMIDRFGSRFVMRIGVVMLGLGFVMLSMVNQLWLFYAIVLVMGLGMNLAGWVTLNTAVVNWFIRKRALALGLSSTGIGIGGLLAPIITWSLVNHGWRPTAFWTGIAIMLIALPLGQLLRQRPQDHGLLPDGDRPTAEGEAPRALPKVVTTVDYTVREAMRDRSFWFVSIGHGMALVSVFAVMVHLVPLLVEGHGWSETSAQAMFAVVSTSSLVGQISGGFLGDRFSKTRISAICMIGHCTALVMMATADSGLVIAMAAAVHGLSWGVRGPLMMAIRADYYGMRNFGTIMGYSSVIVMIGPLLGPALAGGLNDHFGSYTEAFLLVGALTGASTIFFLLARKPPLPQRAQAARVAQAEDQQS